MRIKIKYYLIFCIVVGLGMGKSYAPLMEIPSLSKFVDGSDYIVKGYVISVKDGNEIPAYKTPYNLDLIERVCTFYVTASFKGNIKKNSTIQIITPSIDGKKVHQIVGGPNFAYLKKGDNCMLGLDSYGLFSINKYRLAGKNFYSDNEFMNYPIASANLNNDAPAGTINEKVVWEFFQNYEKGTIKEALTANDIYMQYGMSSQFPLDNQRIINLFLTLYKNSVSPRRDVLAISLYYLQDTTGLPQIFRNAEDTTSDFYEPSYSSLWLFSTPTTNPKINKLIIKGLSSNNEHIRQGCINHITYRYQSPEAVDAIVKLSMKSNINDIWDINIAFNKLFQYITPTQKREMKKAYLKMINEGNKNVQRMGISYLQWVGDTCVIPILARYLMVDPSKEKEGPDNPNGLLRAAAIQTLSNLGGNSTIPIIIKGTQFPDRITQVRTVQVLKYKLGLDFGYDITQQASKDKQKAALEKYMEWWNLKGKYIDWK